MYIVSQTACQGQRPILSDTHPVEVRDGRSADFQLRSTAAVNVWFASCWASGRSWTLGWIQSNMNPNQLVPPASLGKSERSDRSKKVSLQPARLREFDNRILCCTKRFYAYWLTKSVTAAVDGRGRRLKSAIRGLRSVWAAKNSRGFASPQIHNAF